MNQRITWLLASQTVLLGTYGLLNQRLTDWFFCPTTEQRAHIAFLLEWVPYLGFMTSLLLLVSVAAAAFAMRKLKLTAPGPTSTSSHPSPDETLDVGPWTTRAGWLGGGLLPLVFCVAWAMIANNAMKLDLMMTTRDQADLCRPLLQVGAALNSTPIAVSPVPSATAE